MSSDPTAHPVGAWEWPLLALGTLGPLACWALAGLMFASGKPGDGAGFLLASIAVPPLASIIWDGICIDRTLARHETGDHSTCRH